MLGLRFYAIYQMTVEINSGAIWEKTVRCGSEFDRETRDANQADDTMLALKCYRSMYEFYRDNFVVDESLPSYQVWYSHFMFLARKVRGATIDADVTWHHVLFIAETDMPSSLDSFSPVITTSSCTRTGSVSRSRTRKWLKSMFHRSCKLLLGMCDLIHASVWRMHRCHKVELRV